MNKDNMLEEMAKDVCTLIKDYGTCERCDAELAIEGDTCIYKCMAKLFAEKGYRKSTEFVEEVFEELKKAGITEHRYPVIAELKKKYTEGEG